MCVDAILDTRPFSKFYYILFSCSSQELLSVYVVTMCIVQQ